MGVLIVLGVLLLCVLSLAFRAGSDLDDRDRRGWWPGPGRR
jgi:hypothetical protein